MTFALGQCFELVYGNDQNPRFPELRHPKSVALRSIMTLEINEIDNLAPIDRFMSFKWCITFLLSRITTTPARSFRVSTLSFRPALPWISLVTVSDGSWRMKWLENSSGCLEGQILSETGSETGTLPYRQI